MRVLVAEDNSAMLDAVTRGLTAEGYDIDAVETGVDALWRAREFPYDAIVLDIMLPGVNGYEICRTLRTDGHKTPILMLTAKQGEHDVAEGLNLGADDYLAKPFSFVVLVARLRAIIRRSAPDLSDTLLAGPVTLDTSTRHCSVVGQQIELTPREYSLLETLMRRRGEPLTRTDLLDRVWGADHDGGSNVVDVYIGYLRRKFSEHVPVEIIETVRGVGYRVVAP